MDRDNRPTRPRTAAALDPSVWKISAVAVLGSLLAQLDATIVNVSLSSLAQDLHSTLPVIQWVTSGYLLALTFVLPLNGWLVDRIGGKALYLWCFSVFTISSALCGLAWSANSLIGFRILQGVSGGLLAPMAQMMMKRAAGDQFTRIAGYAAFPILLGPLLGPVIAGAILHYASWRWLFLVNLPVGLLALVLALRFLPDDREERKQRELDWLGLLLLSPGLALVLFGAERIGRHTGLVAMAAGIVLLVGFLRVEKRKAEHALIDLGQFRSRTFAVASVAQFLSNGVMFAGQMLIPLFLIEACGQSPAMMGWLLAPLGLGMMLTFPSLGLLTGRFGARAVATGGAALTLCATLALAWLAGRGLDLFVLVPALFVRGMGQGAVGLPAISVAYASIERRDLPMATTTLNIVQRLGGPTLTTLCALFLAWMLETHGGSGEPHAWVFAFLLLAALHALTVLAAAGLPRRARG
ncbi:DHA2 family efflux MFS transporter permease subunit [Paraburkholderia caballeronis]|uniref:DHA2 family efflux MFS transporter permease subunit n=1 Tax=Paraburkholderia caballeronis TaxID=416943 RepID=UPI0010671331|nr:DHA2 family efflux MFS transporter permease subunit [Paraburkholderia caballeronis]TDV15822.1 EmrB/QacA subfamily drug resistance transporter [Paraburkholderia caballeronis]TDV18077.1 EmrB/QacA subfamily drug resistance transporter [Paraburkholderia caballeronis]TDV26309.1 EmrB/QacA subfamily drug resistance transporter [Paraburkholderia caballeronis]